MAQQLGIIVVIDVASAIKFKSLDGNVYMFDNMKLQGSEGLGTGSLVSALHGTHWMDGSQANELVLNWASGALGSVPPTLPKTFCSDLSKNADLQALNDIQELTSNLETERDRFSDVESVLDELRKISENIGVTAKLQSQVKNVKNQVRSVMRELGMVSKKVIDVRGELITDPSAKSQGVSQISPLITNISGEAVDKKVMYVAQYGSPDLITDGWYWSASVDSSKPGTYAYTMDIQLHKQSFVDGEWILTPIDLACEAYIKVDNNAKVNGFTGGGIHILPIK